MPILVSYIFIGAAYGILMDQAGMKWYYSLLVSFSVYTGAFQFVLTTFLSAGASLVTVILTAILMNSRQSFYSLTFLEDFNKYKYPQKLYMIHTLTDETYAVNCSLELPEEEKRSAMFQVAFFSRCYWLAGTLLGAVLGQLIPYNLEGIDFCMTALFVIIFIDQWEKAQTHRPALIGLGAGILALVIFGQSSFMLPAFLLASGVILLMNRKEKRHE